MRPIFASILFALILSAGPALAANLDAVQKEVRAELVAEHGEAIAADLDRGMSQVAALWTDDDGSAEDFAQFVRTHFAADATTRQHMFERMELYFEQVEGLLYDAIRQLRWHVDRDVGPIEPFDRLFAAYNPSAHLTEDLFENKIAFVVLLNFPLSTLEQRLTEGADWTRQQWAESRLADRFSSRVPAGVNQAISEASSDAGNYISEYNLWMHHILTDDGRRLFDEGKRLITHWNLRDEIKGRYGTDGALEAQRLVQKAMEAIATQTIPEIVVDNPRVDWMPYSNKVAASSVIDFEEDRYPALESEPTAAREPDTRFAKILASFHARKKADPYYPTASTRMARAFDLQREIPEERVRAMFEAVLTSPLAGQVAQLVRDRLGRDLEPFDIWYPGFKSTGALSDEDLSEITRKRYPDADAFARDIPRILRDLGFDAEMSDYVASMVEVHASRGAGHAFGASKRGDKAYLRTRVGEDGMDYKGYNIAVHELGHNVEQTLSLNRIDHTLLQGVPNTAFTEAMAFVFQDRDLELLGLDKPSGDAKALSALDEFWGTFEIAGVAMVDMDVWHWMYANPDASAEDLKNATIEIAQKHWNNYFAPHFGSKDSPLLAVYSHMISRSIYLPNYPLGHMIAFQIKEKVEQSGSVGPEFARMSMIGRIAPDLWMREATGNPVGPEALLAATEKALAQLGSKAGR